MSIRHTQALCILLCLSSYTIVGAETLAAVSHALPWIDSSASLGASSFRFMDDATGVSINAFALDIPALSPDLFPQGSLPAGVLGLSDMTVPLVHASLSRSLGSFGIAVQAGALSIPLRKTEIDNQTLSIRPETGWFFGAGASFKSLSVHSVLAFDSALLYAGSTNVGSVGFSCAGASVSWGGITVFWGEGIAEASVSAHLRLDEMYGFSFEGAAEGSVSALGAAYRRNFTLGGGELSFFASAGVLDSDALSSWYSYDYNSDSLAGAYSFSYDRAPFAAVRFGYEQSIGGVWRLEAFRALAYASAPRTITGSPSGDSDVGTEDSLTASACVDAVSNSIDTVLALDPVTLLFAGTGFAVTYCFR